MNSNSQPDPSVTHAEMSKAKAATESAILKVLDGFQQATGLQVQLVDFQRAPQCIGQSRLRAIIGVTVSAGLP